MCDLTDIIKADDVAAFTKYIDFIAGDSRFWYNSQDCFLAVYYHATQIRPHTMPRMFETLAELECFLRTVPFDTEGVARLAEIIHPRVMQEIMQLSDVKVLTALYPELHSVPAAAILARILTENDLALAQVVIPPCELTKKSDAVLALYDEEEPVTVVQEYLHARRHGTLLYPFTVVTCSGNENSAGIGYNLVAGAVTSEDFTLVLKYAERRVVVPPHTTLIMDTTNVVILVTGTDR